MRSTDAAELHFSNLRGNKPRQKTKEMFIFILLLEMRQSAKKSKVIMTTELKFPIAIHREGGTFPRNRLGKQFEMFPFPFPDKTSQGRFSIPLT